MFIIEVEFHDQVTGSVPSWRWRCPLCKIRVPSIQSELRIFDKHEVDVQARVHMITKHGAEPAMLSSKFLDPTKEI